MNYMFYKRKFVCFSWDDYDHIHVHKMLLTPWSFWVKFLDGSGGQV